MPKTITPAELLEFVKAQNGYDDNVIGYIAKEMLAETDEIGKIGDGHDAAKVHFFAGLFETLIKDLSGIAEALHDKAEELTYE